MELVFQNSSISNTGVSAAYILTNVHFLYHKLGSFFNMEYYFQLAYRDSKVSKHFVGLFQMQCSSSFDCNWGKQNKTHCMLATPTISGFTAREMSRLPTRLRGRGHQIPNCVGHSLYNSPCLIFRAKGSRKTINLFLQFSWSYPWYQLHTFGVLHNARNTVRTAWGQMSHICDISPLRIKRKLNKLFSWGHLFKTLLDD